MQAQEYRSIGGLRNWKDNPRSIKKDKFEELKRRITKRGQIKPLIITPDGEVLGGNMRLRAMQELGIKEAWVSVVEPTSEADKIEIALTDNEEMGYYEDQALAELIARYKDDIDLSKYSVHLGQSQTLEEILKQFSPDEVVEDEAPEVADEAVSELGKVYQLGRHMLMCGDSTKIEDVEKLMDGKKADFGFCDPPYNLGFDYNLYEDNKTEKEYEQFTHDWFSCLLTHTDRQCITLGTKNIKLSLEMNAELSGVACWVKKNWITSCRIAKLQQWEPIVFYGDYTKHKRASDLYEINRVEQKDVGKDHTCPKQITLIADIVKNYSDHSVLDLFGGSGTTLIACEQTNRICYMMELDEKYCDVIRKRYAKLIDPDNWEGKWQEMTPKTA